MCTDESQAKGEIKKMKKGGKILGYDTELKDTYKTLDETIKSYTERKSKIEMLIKALSEEEGDLKGDRTRVEDENE